MVYELSGPLFFAAAGKLVDITYRDDTKVLVLRMRSVSALDATAMHRLEELFSECKEKGIQIVFSHVNEQPMKVMKKAKFDEKIGAENFQPHVDEALERAKALAKAAK